MSTLDVSVAIERDVVLATLEEAGVTLNVDVALTKRFVEVSLVSTRGFTGAQGPQGAMGPTGETGADGQDGQDGGVALIPSSLSDGEYQGTPITLTAGEALQFGDPCTVNASGKIVKSNHSALATSGTYFLAVSTAAEDESVDLLTFGVVCSSSWSWTPGPNAWVYPTASGTLSQTPPASQNNVIQPIGIPLSATLLLLFPPIPMLMELRRDTT